MYDYRNADGTVDPEKLRACIAAAAAHEDATHRAAYALKFASIEASRDSRRSTQVSARADAKGITLDVFGDIGESWFSEGFTARHVAAALKETTGTITLRINSGGGDAFEGSTIYGLLSAAPNRVEVEILGLAASAATFPVMAADEVRMADSAVMMIHNHSIGVRGGVADLESAAQLLRGVDAQIAGIYAARSGRKSAAEMTTMMAATTWLTAQEAVELGLADRVVKGTRATAHAHVDLSSAPEQVRALLAAAQRVTPTHMPLELLKRLGLAADATEEQIVAALDAALAAAAVPEPVAAPAAPVINSVPDLSEQHQLAASTAVERFIGEGKIAPASRAKALAACGSTAAQLTAAVQYWESIPSLTPARVTPAAAPAAAAGRLPARQALSAQDNDQPTRTQLRMCREAKITWEQFKAQRAEDRARQALRRGEE